MKAPPDAAVSMLVAFLDGRLGSVLEIRERGFDGRNLEIIAHSDYRRLRVLEDLPKRFHVIGLLPRPGVRCFTRALELTYFPPNTPRNQDFTLHWVLWETMPFVLVTIPLQCQRFADRSAARFRLRLVEGIPTVITGDSRRHFPMTGTNQIRTLEFASPFPADINSLNGWERLQDAESRALDEIERSFFDPSRRN